MPGAFPEEHLGRRPPPSTSYPCRVWFCRRRRPFFCRGEAAVAEGLAPVELAFFVQLAQEHAPDLEPQAGFFPVAQATPAGGRRGKILRQILPSRAAAQNPQDAFQAGTILRGRTATLARSPGLRQERFDPFPLCVC